MIKIVESASEMVRQMNPDLRPGRFVFCSLPLESDQTLLLNEAIATFREDEGVSMLLPERTAEIHGLQASEPMCQITLRVYSALSGVGLTAVVSAALARKSIPCNMIAALFHDHVFVPADRAKDALAELKLLQNDSRE